MPNAPQSRIYWDACVFLDYIDGRAEVMPILDAILAHVSQDPEKIIVTSAISVTEVAFAKVEKTGRALDPEIEQSIDALWNDPSVVRLVEYSEVIARTARSLLRKKIELGRQLKPMDAIHLATAIEIGAEDFHTYDGPLIDRWNDLPFPVRNPVTDQPMLFSYNDGEET